MLGENFTDILDDASPASMRHIAKLTPWWQRLLGGPQPIPDYDVDAKGTIHLPTCAPYDGKPVLIKIAGGWLEAYWVPSEPYEDHEGNKDDNGWFWCGLDDDKHVDFEEPTHWAPLPGASLLQRLFGSK